VTVAPKPESPLAPCPTCGQPRECREFVFDHASYDSARDRAILQILKRLGIELGAQVTLWYYAPCDFADAVFVYPRDRAPS
jgi:hypothetical protein